MQNCYMSPVEDTLCAWYTLPPPPLPPYRQRDCAQRKPRRTVVLSRLSYRTIVWRDRNGGVGCPPPLSLTSAFAWSERAREHHPLTIHQPRARLQSAAPSCPRCSGGWVSHDPVKQGTRPVLFDARQTWPCH